MENSESKKGRTLSIAFIVVLVAVALFTVIGMIAMRHQPLVLQGRPKLPRFASAANCRDASTPSWLKKASG